MRAYHLPARDFAALASGYGGAEAMSILASAQLSKHLLLLTELLRGAGPGDGLGEATDLLVEAQRRNPQIVADVLADPSIGVWLSRCLRTGDGRRAYGRYVAAVAAAAAARVGVDAELTVPLAGGEVWVPTLGVVSVDRGGDDAKVRVRAGAVTVAAGSAVAAGGRQGLRRLGGSDGGFAVSLVDVGPFRDCYGLPVAGRLASADGARWSQLFDAAWALIARYAPTRAAELTVGLRSLVPLATAAGRPGLSATSRDAFGAFAMTAPVDPATFAVTIVHEYQHNKLGALLDLVPLYRRSDPARYRVPWRPDPRPVGAALQGAYAFLGVADMWEALRADGRFGAVARDQFEQTRENVGVALDNLARGGAWTDEGRRFLDGMRVRLDELLKA
jgi:HEXXH motif-containing protein